MKRMGYRFFIRLPRFNRNPERRREGYGDLYSEADLKIGHDRFGGEEDFIAAMDVV